MVTVTKLIHRFEEKLREYKYDQFGKSKGNEPYFPMIVIFLGEEAIEGCRDVIDHLYEMWPSYKNEFLFLGIIEDTDGIKYSKLNINDDEINSVLISSEEIGKRVSTLFGLKSYFRDHSRLLLYYVLDTTCFDDAANFEHWISVMKSTKNTFIDHSLVSQDMLIVLLNENIGQRQLISRKIKNALYNSQKEHQISIMLLSNRRNDDIILEDWELCYKIIANTIALTNNNHTKIARVLFDNGIYTAAYAYEGKPTSKIGQIVIKKLIERLSQESFGPTGDIFADSNISSKLGLSSEGTIVLLDSYAENNLFNMLPTPEQLELFPRKDCVDYVDISEFSERDFNDLTMDCWDSFLNQIIQHILENVFRDSSLKSEWKQEYLMKISSLFSINELIWMCDHIEDVRKFLSNVRLSSPDVQVLRAAKTKVKYMLSSNSEFVEIFVETIVELGNNAKDFLKEWNRFLKSGLGVHSIRDVNLKLFYSKKVQNYLDHNGMRISEAFRSIMDMGALTKFLYDIIDKIIESDSVFLDSFENELDKRLQVEASSINAKQYIRQKLTGEKVPVYCKAPFSLGVPVASSILIKVGSPLHSSLVDYLPDSTYYYDTGSGDFAEALNYFAVSYDNLVS